MDVIVEHHGMLPPSIPAALVAGLAAAAALAWVALHLLIPRPRSRLVRFLLFLGRVGVGCTALWLALNALGRVLLLANPWSVWIPALAGAAATEICIGLYRLERETLSRRAGAVLIGLRLALVLLVILIIVQPVFSWEETRTADRYVAVLLDESASMYLIDKQLSVSEKLRLVQVFLPETADRPYRLEESLDHLRTVGGKLAAHADWLALLKDASHETLSRQLSKRRDSMGKLLGEVVAAADAEQDVLSAVRQSALDFNTRTRAGMKGVAEKLRKDVRDPVAVAGESIAAAKPEELVQKFSSLMERMRHAQKALKSITTALPALAVDVDEAYFASLTEPQRNEINQAVIQSRRAIARAVLLTRTKERPALIDVLGKTYFVRFYRFSGRPAQQDVTQWREAPGPADEAASDLGELSPETRTTDLAGALEKVLVDIPAGKLAGVLVLSDGRHNARKIVAPPARRLGSQRAPVCSVLIGSATPPPDAVVTGIVAPKAVFAEDRVVIEAGLKFDGLRGKEAVVKLTCDGETLDQYTIRVPSNRFRTMVNLTDTPKAKGIRAYHVELQQFDGEAFSANNSREVNIAVTEERTKLLIVEGRPRWEFRYLRNLFAGRDKSVKLQHVLINPDWITDAKRPKVHASVSRAVEEVEASDLPENEAEWLKFDVIVLGDVSPQVLGEEELAVIEKFVAERGGTLIVIAGPQYMPHAFGGSPLRDLLPVTCEATTEVLLGEDEPSFRIALSKAGRNHVVMRQSDVLIENLRVWASRPEIYWRHPITGAKDGASVLAFAMPEIPPDIFTAQSAMSARKAEERERARRQFERAHALIAVQKFALGQVMMLTFDRTWRLRYRVGDTYHHKFWGQVLRWATPGKLQAGTDLVRLGTDRMLYTADEPVRVQAKILSTEDTPAADEEVAVNVYEGTQLILRKTLDYVPDSAGVYEAGLGTLPADRRYTIELDSKAAARLLAEDQEVQKVQTEIMVVPTQTAELIELATDRSVLENAARLSGGVVVEPRRAHTLADRFGKGTEEITEPKPYLLWNSWPLLIIMVVIVTTEWCLRKRVGLI